MRNVENVSTITMTKTLKTEIERDIENNGGERVRYFSLRPMICLLILSACYNVKKSRTKLLEIILWSYQGIVILNILAYMVRTLSLLASDILSYLTPIFLTCQCVGSCFICWKLFSRRYGHFHESMVLWQTSVSKMVHEEILINFKHFNRMQIAVVSFTIFIHVASTTTQFLITFVMYSREELDRIGYNTTFTAPFQDTVASRILVTTSVCLQIVTLITPTFFLMVISIMICTGFRALNKYLVHRRGRNEPFARMENIRQIHLDMCQVVSMLDRDLRLLYGNIYFWTLGLSIIILYSLVKFPLTLYGSLVYLFYLCLTLGMLFAVSIFAAYVHEEVGTPWSAFRNVRSLVLHFF